MATLEELTVEAQAEIDARKPIMKAVNGDVSEFSEADYAQAVTDLANFKFDEQENGYKQARIDAYGSIADQLDMQYWDLVNGTTTWQEHIAQVKSDNPKPA
jgi:hypothetical protein